MNLRYAIRKGCTKIRTSRKLSSRTLIDQLFPKELASETTSSSIWDQLDTPTNIKTPLDLINYDSKTKFNFDDIQLVKIGRAFKQYAFARSSLSQEQVRMNFNRDQYFELGRRISERSPSINKHFNSLIPSSTINSFARKFNELAPYNFILDTRFLTNSSDDFFELPKLNHVNAPEFNPLFLIDIDRLTPFRRMIQGVNAVSKENDEDIRLLLGKLYSYGKTSVTFHLLLHSFPKESLSGSITKIIKHSLLYRSIPDKSAQRYLKRLIEKDSAYNEKVFYQYIGFLLLSEEFPIAWLKKIFDENSVSLKEPNEFPVLSVPAFEGQRVVSSSTGTDGFFDVLLEATTHDLRNEESLKQYAKIIFSHIDSQNKSIYKTPELINQWMRNDASGFRAFIKQYFRGDISKISQSAMDEIKDIIFQTDPPLPIIDKLEGMEIPDTICNSFLSINSSIIRSASEKSSLWKKNEGMKSILWKFNELGSSRYKHMVSLFLEKYPQRYYHSSLTKLINSNELKKYFVQSSRYFEIQPHDSSMLSRLIRYRQMNNLVTSQFYQNLSLMTYKSQEKLISGMVSRLLKVLDNLTNEEVDEFFSDVFRELNGREFTLSILNKDRILQKLHQYKNQELLASFEVKAITNEADEAVLSTGKNLVIFTIMKYNLNCGLTTFLQSVKETTDILETLYPDNKFYRIIGANEIEGKSTERDIEDLINVINFRKANSVFDLNSIGKINVQIANRDIDEMKTPSLLRGHPISLPRLRETDLSKLCLINYFHSRTFLNEVKSNQRNQNRLPDLITIVGSIGASYYNYLIAKKLASFVPNINPKDFERLESLFQDKKFKRVVSEVSNLTHSLTHHDPKINSKIHALCTALERKSSRNEYYQLRYHAQIFNQYIGALVLSDREVLLQWIDQTVGSIISRVDDSTYLDDLEEIIRS